MPPGSLRGLVLASDDLQRDHEELVARGLKFDGPPRERPWGAERSSPTPTETSSSFIRPDDLIANASLGVFGEVFGRLDKS
jgi:hypothetical protein